MATDGDDLARHMQAVAAALIGEHNQRLSKAGDLRFGKNGSFSVDPKKGTWYDHEAKEGGGILALIEREKGLRGSDALDYLSQITNGAFQSRGGGTANRSRQPSRSSADAPPWHDDDPGPPDVTSGRQGAHARPQGGAGPSDLKQAMRAGPTKVYTYEGPQGDLVLEVCRYEWIENGERQKTFRQRRKPLPSDPPDKIKGGWVWSIAGIDVVPYRLMEVRAAIESGLPVLIAEGEKDADTLASWGLAGTTNPMGAGKWPECLNQHFAGAKKIILLRDNDAAGVNHANVVGASLRRALPEAEISVMGFDDLGEKEDVTDFRDKHGGDLDGFLDRLERDARPWQPQLPVSRYGAMRYVDIDRPGPEVEWLWDGWLTLQDKSIIGGESQSGKSFFAINLGMSIARYAGFLGSETEGGLVCYQAGESARGARRRLRAYRVEHQLSSDVDIPFVLLSKRIDLFSKDGGDVQGLIDEVRAWQAYYFQHPLRWLCIDTLARAAIGAEENSAKDMGIVLDNMDRLEQALGCAVTAVHHMNANGQKLRGSTAVYANVEQVLAISRDPANGIRTLKAAKMKDDADGGSLRFELKVHKLGIDKRERDITSCVVMPAGWKEAERGEEPPQEGEKVKGFRIWAELRDPLLAIMTALKHHGEIPPVDLAERYGLGPELRVVQWVHVREAFEKTTDEINPEKIQKRLANAGSKLRQYGIIARDNPYVWWTGKPVEGVSQTWGAGSWARRGKNQAQQPEPENPAVDVPEWVDNLLGG